MAGREPFREIVAAPVGVGWIALTLSVAAAGCPASAPKPRHETFEVRAPDVGAPRVERAESDTLEASDGGVLAEDSTATSPDPRTEPSSPPTSTPVDSLPVESGGGPVPSPSTRLPVQGAAFTAVTWGAGVLYSQGPAHRPDDEDFYFQQGFVDAEEWTSGGAAAGDFDGDGWTDLYVTRVHDHDLLFRNEGDGTFVDVSAAAGLAAWQLASNGAGFGDIDNDGDLDLYVTALLDSRFYLFINDAGVFREEGVLRGAAIESSEPHGGHSVAFGDYDRDGWLDIHTTDFRWRTEGPGSSHARLLRNRGAEGFPGHFEDVTVAAGVGLDVLYNGEWRSLSFTSSFSDLDEDGWPDLVVASDNGTSRLFWNAGDGTFTEGTVEAGVGTDDFGMGSAIGDYDGDGRLDWFVTSVYGFDGPSEEWGNRLYRNRGDRTFEDATDAAGVRDGGWGWGTSFLDTDNDGDLDLVATNGYRWPFALDATRLWVNDGAGVMTETAASAGVIDTGDGKGLVVADFDRDGDEDLFVVDHAGTPHFYRNDLGHERTWLTVRLEGIRANRQGIGARVELQAEPNGPVLVREIGGGSNYLGQNEAVAHFGLGAHRGPVHRVEIVWPTPCAERTRQVLSDVPVDQYLVVTEPQCGI